MSSVLATGVYCADRPHVAGHIIHELAASREHSVTQRWTALAPGGAGAFDLPATVAVEVDRLPKCALIDAMSADAAAFDWIIIVDDDVELPPAFLDRFLDCALRFDFALCQPARTEDSYIDHPIVMRMPGLAARRTRFVEIGPLVAFRRDAVPLLLPFGEAGGMGWGLDLVWPRIIEAAGLRMGIVDAAPVAHRMRRPVEGYRHEAAAAEMFRRLAAAPHLAPHDAFTIVEAYA